jgi:hypothetical protein
MNSKINIFITVIISISLLLVACSPTTPQDPNDLPQLNVDDYATTTTISDLIDLPGMQQCNWDFAGDDSFGVEPTIGSFTVVNGAYYLENLRDGYHRWAVFDQERFYSWNDNPDRGNNVGQNLSVNIYQSSVLNTIGYRTHFAMLENVDYGIECSPFSGTLPTFPSGMTWIPLG